MITRTKQKNDFIKMIANRLAKRFIEPLILLSKEKNYAAGIGGLEEILDWSQEFYERYYDKISDWERFKMSSDNIYNVITPDDLIIAFGQDRIKKFYMQNANHDTYFIEKYSDITLERK